MSALNNDNGNSAVPVVKADPLPPVYVTINGQHVVDANAVDKYQVGDVLISGLNNLGTDKYRTFSFTVNK